MHEGKKYPPIPMGLNGVLKKIREIPIVKVVKLYKSAKGSKQSSYINKLLGVENKSLSSEEDGRGVSMAELMNM